MTQLEYVILVDKNDVPIGTAEKLAAHINNQCHRAFSIFIINQNTGQILLQQRAKSKYHTPLLWTNTCCSHPRPGEDVIAAGQRRLKEEMGLSIELHSVGYFHYIAHFDNGLVENELDHVLIGYYNQEVIVPNPDEVETYRWVGIAELKQELVAAPMLFTPWLGQALEFIKDL